MRYCFFFIGLLVCICTDAQKNKKLSRAEYIEEYKELAMEEMSRTGIPASITLAQGILESGDGNSTLSVKANNHFGIKCHDWEGPSVRHDDDAKNECFRKYKSSEQSYKDHSDFLTSRTRYAELFELDIDDYKSWAKGLKKAGYATSPTYAKALISVIEENQLYVYDKEVIASLEKKKNTQESEFVNADSKKQIKYNNRVKYVIADSGDTFLSLAEELSLFPGQLSRYNDANPSDVLHEGDYVYLQPKRRQAHVKYKTHVVLNGEDLHAISQKYAIKETKLRKSNNISENSEPAPGVVIVLRGKLDKEIAHGVAAASKTENEKKEQVKGDSPKDKSDFIIEYDLDG